MTLDCLHRITRFLPLLILLKTVESLDVECQSDPRRYYPHYICTKYYECFLLIKVARDCRYGQNFNPYEGVCDYSNPNCDTNIYQKAPPKFPPNFYPTPDPEENIGIYQKAPPKFPPNFYPTPDPDENINIYQKAPPKFPPIFYPTPDPKEITKIYQKASPNFYTTRIRVENPKPVDTTPKTKPIDKDCRALINEIDFWTTDKEIVMDCKQYLDCAKHGPVLNGCPKGMNLSKISGLCEFPENVNCEDVKENNASYEEYNRRTMDRALHSLNKIPLNKILQLHENMAIHAEVTGNNIPKRRIDQTVYQHNHDVTGNNRPKTRVDQTVYQQNHEVTGNNTPKTRIDQMVYQHNHEVTGNNTPKSHIDQTVYQHHHELTVNNIPKTRIDQTVYQPNHEVTGNNTPKTRIDQTVYQHHHEVTRNNSPKTHIDQTVYQHTYENTSSHPEDSIENVSCPTGYYGPMEHPRLCDSYIMCAIDGPLDMRCYEGLEYNPKIKKCEEFSVGGCSDINKLVYFEKPTSATDAANTDGVDHPTSITTESVGEIEQHN